MVGVLEHLGFGREELVEVHASCRNSFDLEASAVKSGYLEYLLGVHFSSPYFRVQNEQCRQSRCESGRPRTIYLFTILLVPVNGIEPLFKAYESFVLPLNYTGYISASWISFVFEWIQVIDTECLSLSLFSFCFVFPLLHSSLYSSRFPIHYKSRHLFVGGGFL